MKFTKSASAAVMCRNIVSVARAWRDVVLLLSFTSFLIYAHIFVLFYLHFNTVLPTFETLHVNVKVIEGAPCPALHIIPSSRRDACQTLIMGRWVFYKVAGFFTK